MTTSRLLKDKNLKYEVFEPRPIGIDLDDIEIDDKPKEEEKKPVQPAEPVIKTRRLKR